VATPLIDRFGPGSKDDSPGEIQADFSPQELQDLGQAFLTLCYHYKLAEHAARRARTKGDISGIQKQEGLFFNAMRDAIRRVNGEGETWLLDRRVASIYAKLEGADYWLDASSGQVLTVWRNDPERWIVRAFASALLSHFGSRRGTQQPIAIEIHKAMKKGAYRSESKDPPSSRTVIKDLALFAREDRSLPAMAVSVFKNNIENFEKHYAILESGSIEKLLRQCKPSLEALTDLCREHAHPVSKD
jgi:hypothetical protein